jgi:predicted ATPase
MEEVVQTLVEEGALVRDPGAGVGFTSAPQGPSLTNFHIPATVQGVLMARIDRLGTNEKDLLQHLAIIGREFPLSLVRRVVPRPEEELYQVLSALQRKEFLYEQPAFPEVEYLFKHALTQEVAYHSVLHERRKALHEQTATAVEALYHAHLDEHYGELAHHYSRSGNREKAVQYLGLAGQQAAQRSANVEAVKHLAAALELLGTLPDTPERTRQELVLQTTLGPVLMATKGYAAPEVGTVYTRARELCQQVGETPQLFPVLLGLRTFYQVRGEFLTARGLGEQLHALARSTQDAALLVEAYRALGASSFHLGELIPARAYLERGIALYDFQQHRSHVFLYGIDPGVFGISYAAWVLWSLGYPDQALKRSQEALTLAQDLSHPHSLAPALVFAAWFHQHCREGRLTRERAATAMALSTEQGFALWLAWGTIMWGWALAEQGQVEEGIAQIQQGLESYQATGAELGGPYFLSLLAEAYRKVGQLGEGLTVLGGALDLVHKNKERHYEAELYRLKGELTRQQSNAQGPMLEVAHARSEAEEWFWQAIELARRQQAKSLELRAVMSLSRLWQSQGKKAEARQLLAEIYGWFTEGFDTKDLQEAKALLEELH